MDINKQLVPVKNIAAIDLGSNSFHMIVAQLINKRFQIISRHKKRVHLASGLDNNKILSEEAMERGLDCLRLFAERIKDFEYKNVRIAATYTLREAKNAHVFITKAKKIFPYDIEGKSHDSFNIFYISPFSFSDIFWFVYILAAQAFVM